MIDRSKVLRTAVENANHPSHIRYFKYTSRLWQGHEQCHAVLYRWI